MHLYQPDWGDNSHTLALEFSHPESTRHLHVIFNAFWEPLNFELPPLEPGDEWLMAINTALPGPEDFPDVPQKLQGGQNWYTVQPRSAVILITTKLPGE